MSREQSVAQFEVDGHDHPTLHYPSGQLRPEECDRLLEHLLDDCIECQANLDQQRRPAVALLAVAASALTARPRATEACLFFSIDDYMLGEMSVRDSVEHALHLAQCPMCHEYFGRREAAVSEVLERRSAAALEIAQRAAEPMLAGAAADETPTPARRGVRRATFVAGVALLAFCFAAWVAVNPRPDDHLAPRPDPTTTPARQAADLTPSMQERLTEVRRKQDKVEAAIKTLAENEDTACKELMEFLGNEACSTLLPDQIVQAWAAQKELPPAVVKALEHFSAEKRIEYHNLLSERLKLFAEAQEIQDAKSVIGVEADAKRELTSRTKSRRERVCRLGDFADALALAKPISPSIEDCARERSGEDAP